MANSNTPRGLVRLRDAGSGKESGGVNMYHVAAADATALYIGDPVVKTGTADTAGIPTVTRAGATGAVTGVVEGFVPDGTTNMLGYRPASTAGYVLVCDDPNEVFEIQENAGLAATAVGLNANMATGSGSAYAKRSGFVLDAATALGTATLQLKILGTSPRADNTFGEAYNKLLVKINNHTEASASAGI